ncbi:hypothetical protein BLOT_006945 [Blomia tropicalis]|nr:hypothetical protein BLOT_006945 [Blomia tropicalis]
MYENSNHNQTNDIMLPQSEIQQDASDFLIMSIMEDLKRDKDKLKIDIFEIISEYINKVIDNHHLIMIKKVVNALTQIKYYSKEKNSPCSIRPSSTIIPNNEINEDEEIEFILDDNNQFDQPENGDVAEEENDDYEEEEDEDKEDIFNTENPLLKHQVIFRHLHCFVEDCPTGRFKRKIDLNQHLVHEHDIPPYRCMAPGCSEKFKEKKLSKHIREKHSSLKTWPCPKVNCCICFTSYENLNQHIMYKHIRGRFPCNRDLEDGTRCKYIGKTRSERTNHMKIHKKISCVVNGCKKKFCNNVSLNMHIKKFHPKKNRNISRYKIKKFKVSNNAETATLNDSTNSLNINQSNENLSNNNTNQVCNKISQPDSNEQTRQPISDKTINLESEQISPNSTKRKLDTTVSNEKLNGKNSNENSSKNGENHISMNSSSHDSNELVKLTTDKTSTSVKNSLNTTKSKLNFSSLSNVPVHKETLNNHHNKGFQRNDTGQFNKNVNKDSKIGSSTKVSSTLNKHTTSESGPISPNVVKNKPNSSNNGLVLADTFGFEKYDNYMLNKSSVSNRRRSRS